jgi:hypothetical protein
MSRFALVILLPRPSVHDGRQVAANAIDADALRA